MQKVVPTRDDIIPSKQFVLNMLPPKVNVASQNQVV